MDTQFTFRVFSRHSLRGLRQMACSIVSRIFCGQSIFYTFFSFTFSSWTMIQKLYLDKVFFHAFKVLTPCSVLWSSRLFLLIVMPFYVFTRFQSSMWLLLRNHMSWTSVFWLLFPVVVVFIQNSSTGFNSLHVFRFQFILNCSCIKNFGQGLYIKVSIHFVKFTTGISS
jgi:hypothetical protein